MTNAKDQNTATAVTAEASPAPETRKGQSAFHVELSPVGVVVRPVFVGEDSSLLAVPAAVFPNLEMAIQQLDELKRLVLHHFSEAAFVGMQALQQSQQLAADSPDASTAAVTKAEGASS